MTNLTGKLGELRMTVEITRKATGKTEVYELIGHVMDEEEETEDKESKNGK